MGTELTYYGMRLAKLTYYDMRLTKLTYYNMRLTKLTYYGMRLVKLTYYGIEVNKHVHWPSIDNRGSRTAVKTMAAQDICSTRVHFKALV